MAGDAPGAARFLEFVGGIEGFISFQSWEWKTVATALQPCTKLPVRLGQIAVVRKSNLAGSCCSRVTRRIRL